MITTRPEVAAAESLLHAVEAANTIAKVSGENWLDLQKMENLAVDLMAHGWDRFDLSEFRILLTRAVAQCKYDETAAALIGVVIYLQRWDDASNL